jgi:2'-hydroxyisoflavone reductase
VKLLIIGGTVFLGRHLVHAALDRGVTVTLFNRGQQNPDLFPRVEKLRGDRDGGMDALSGRRWDAVIDTCGYFPRVVRASAECLAAVVDHYTFISSISVFSNLSQVGIDETAPVGRLDDPAVEEVTGETYGPLKALCEEAVEATMPGRALIIRPGLIVGPHDPTDRFTYWPHRIARGGAVLAPGSPDCRIQFIDARDLARWTLRMIDRRQTGNYNATGPDYGLSMGTLLEECKTVSGSDARLVWASDEYLLGKGVQPWMGLPLWIPDAPDTAGFSAVNCGKALRSGLTFLPLGDTIRDTLAWDASRPENRPWKAGLSPDREAELLNGMPG